MAPVRAAIRWFIVAVIVIAALAIFLSVVRSAGLDIWTVTASVLLVIGALLLEPVTRWYVRRQYRSLESQQAWVRFDAWGLHFENPLGRQEVPWITLTDVTQAGRVILFRRDTLTVGYLPRSAFVSPAQEDDALAFASDSIGVSPPELPEQPA